MAFERRSETSIPDEDVGTPTVPVPLSPTVPCCFCTFSSMLRGGAWPGWKGGNVCPSFTPAA